MKQTHIAVFFGGCSPEYHVSLQAAAAVIRNLNRDKTVPYPIGITQDGDWFLYTGDISGIADDSWHRQKDACIPVFLSPSRSSRCLLLKEETGLRALEIDAAFPVLHGKNGEDGTIQGLLSLCGIALVGCGVLASALCMDKERAHRLAKAAGVAVPNARAFGPKVSPKTLLAFGRSIGYPLFVKPVKAGSSFGVTRVSAESQLLAAVELAFSYDDEILLEEAIEGFEVGCAVMGTETLTVGEVDEIELAGGFFNYTEKYTLTTSAIHVPARISPAAADRVKETAKLLYRALACSGFARVDLFLTPQGGIVFNEINTIPGFTEHSRFPKMMQAAGISFSQILETVIEEAIRS